MGFLTYSPTEVIVTLAGVYRVHGFASGTFLKIIKDEKPYETEIAMDGETARSFNKNENYKVSLVLAQSSLSNDILSALHQIDLATHLGKFPLLIQDKSGSTKFFATNAWIDTFPSASYGNSLETREWVIQCSNVAYSLGGNDVGKVSEIAQLLSLSAEVASLLGVSL